MYFKKKKEKINLIDERNFLFSMKIFMNQTCKKFKIKF